MQEEKQEMDELDLQIERRKEIYEHELYVKVSDDSCVPDWSPPPRFLPPWPLYQVLCADRS